MKKSVPGRLAALAMTLGLANAAGACDLRFDETLRLWRGNCPLTIEGKGPWVPNEFVIARRTLKIPDLIIEKLKFRLTGNQLDVHADVKNAGVGASPSTVVDLNVTMFDPANPALTSVVPLRSAPFPALASQASLRVFVGTVTADHSLHDVDLLVNGMVDPVSNATPLGRVFEWVESNNGVSHMCRVYGPTPDLTLEPCN